MNIVSYQENTA